MLSPLEEHNKLINKIKHTKSYDPALSATRIAKRHGCNSTFVQKVLKGEALYPGYYQQLSKKYKIDVDKIQTQMETGNRYCIRCEDFRPKDEFVRVSQGSFSHMKAHCEDKQDDT